MRVPRILRCALATCVRLVAGEENANVSLPLIENMKNLVGRSEACPNPAWLPALAWAIRLTTWLVRKIPFNTARHCWLQSSDLAARETTTKSVCLSERKFPASVKAREATNAPVCIVCLRGRSLLSAAMLHAAFSIAVSADFVGTRYLQPPVYGARQTSSRLSISERDNTLWENSH